MAPYLRLCLLRYPPTDLIRLRLLLCPVPIFLPFCLFCLLIHRWYTFHIHPVLFPPLLGYPWPRSPMRCHTQVHNGPGHNEMCGRFLVAGDTGLHILQYRFCHRTIYQGVYPHSVPSSTRLPPCQPVCHPVVESTQQPTNVQHHHLRL